MNDKFKIARRYGHLVDPRAGPSALAPAHNSLSFDLNLPMQEEIVDANRPLRIDVSSFPLDSDLIERIRSQLINRRCGPGGTLGRIVLHSVRPVTDTRAFLRFLHVVRALARSHFAVVVVSLPTYLMQSDHVERISAMFDTILDLHSFVGRRSPYGPSHDGLVQIRRLPTMNTWNVIRPESIEFLFKIRKSEVVVERVSMPVDSSSRAGDAPSAIAAPSACSGDLPVQLQF